MKKVFKGFNATGKKKDFAIINVTQQQSLFELKVKPAESRG